MGRRRIPLSFEQKARPFLDKMDKNDIEETTYPGKGRGVCAIKDICNGDFVVQYYGELLSGAEGERREEYGLPSVYRYFFVHRGKSYCVDATSEPKSGMSGPKLGRLVNDSRKQFNTRMKVIVLDNQVYLALFAIRNINRGEEIVYDYGIKDRPWETKESSYVGKDGENRPSKSLPTNNRQVSQPTDNQVSGNSDPAKSIDSELRPGGQEQSEEGDLSYQEPIQVESLPTNSRQVSQPTDDLVSGNSDHLDKPIDSELRLRPGGQEQSEEGDLSYQEPIQVDGENQQSKSVPTNNQQVSQPTDNQVSGNSDHPAKSIDGELRPGGQEQSEEGHLSYQEPIQLGATDGQVSGNSDYHKSTRASGPEVMKKSLETEEVYSSSNPTDLGFSDSDSPSVSESDPEYVANSDSEESDGSEVYSNYMIPIPKLLDISAMNENSVSSTSDISVNKYNTPPLVHSGSSSLQNSLSNTAKPSRTDASPQISTSSDVTDKNPTSTTNIGVMSTSNETSRVYDKRFYCLYCSQPFSKLPRHLVKQHPEQPEVAKYVAEEDKEVKAQMICKLRNLGNHQHNSQVIQQNSGLLVVAYRPTSPASWEDYVPCELCLGYYVHWDLWKHLKRCPLQTKDKKQQGRVVTNSRLLLPVPKGTSEGLQTVLVTLNSDEVSRIVKSDPLILQLGEKLYHKHGHDREQFSTMRNTLRELGRLLRSLRQMVGPFHAGLAEFIDPLQFQNIVKAAKEVAGFSENTHLFRTPSLGLKLGSSLKKCAKIVKGNALQRGDEVLLKQSVAFWELCEMNWTDEISTHALRTLGENKRNKVKLVPLTSDCQLLTNHLKEKGGDAYKALQVNKRNKEAWCDLCEAALTQVILFNRRRQGEASKMTLDDFVGKHSAGEEDISKTLSPLEQKLCQALTRIEIVGKRGRTVPVILTSEMKRWIDLLIETREKAGVAEANKFVFARANYGSLGHVRGCDCLNAFSEDCGAKHPKLLRSTKLRKQIATLSQLLNLKDNELDIVANFLGHDIRVHRDIYRLPEHTLQVAKVSKLLFSLENGQFSQQCGKSLDEISVDIDEEIGIEVGELDPSEDEDESDEEPTQVDLDDSDADRNGGATGTAEKKKVKTSGKRRHSKRAKEGDDSDADRNVGATGTAAPSKAKVVKKVWTELQKEAVMQHFDRHIQRQKIPGKAEIEQCLKKELVLQKRSWQNVKDFVRNKIQTNKSKKLF